MTYLYYLVTGLIILCIFVFFYKKKRKLPNGKFNVPFVKEGYVPIIGHGNAFSEDNIKFLRNCYKKYGPVFKLQIFRKTLIVVCDHSLKEEYFSTTEDNMSLNEALKDLYLNDAFSDHKNGLDIMFSILKKTIKINFEEIAPKIMDEADNLINKLKMKSNQNLDMSSEMINFITHTSARCFIGKRMPIEFYNNMLQFTELLNKVIVMTYIYPKPLLNLIYKSTLRDYRTKMIHLLNSEIEQYRQNITLKESSLIRTCIDNYKLSNQQIGELIICLLYVSSENTSLGLSAVVTDLICNPNYWRQVRSETKPLLENNDIKSLFANPLLDACVTESARMNTHIFPIGRKPRTNNLYLGKYYVSDCDSIVLCEPLMMLHECSNYTNSLNYYPGRFLGSTPESKLSKDILTWGSGHHLCPGKMFACYEIKAAVALLVNHFNIPKVIHQGQLDYFSPSAFAERKLIVNLQPLFDPIQIKASYCQKINYQGRDYDIDCIYEDGHRGWIIRQCFTKNEQIEAYRYTVELSKSSMNKIAKKKFCEIIRILHFH